MQIDSIFAQFANIKADYVKAKEFQNQMLEEAVDFLLSKSPSLENKLSREEIEKLISSRDPDNEKVDIINEETKDLNGEVGKYAINIKRSNAKSFIFIFKNFLSRKDIEEIFKNSNENVYWISNYIRELLIFNRFTDKTWLEDYFILGFGNPSSSQSVYKKIFSACCNNFTYQQAQFEGVTAQARKGMLGKHINMFFCEPIFHSMSAESRQSYIQALHEARLTPEAWLELSINLKPFGIRIPTLPIEGNEESTKWLESELSSENNPQWLEKLCARCTGRNSTYFRQPLEQALLNNLENIDFSKFSDAHCKEIKSPEPIEKIFEACSLEGQKRLALNYLSYYEEQDYKDVLNWDLVEKYADLIANVWFSYDALIPLDKLNWFWKTVKTIDSKRYILRTLYLLIAQRYTNKENVNDLLALYVNWYGENSTKFDDSQSIVEDFYVDSNVKTAVELWPHVGDNIRSAFVRSANDHFNDLHNKGGDREALLTLVCQHDLNLAIHSNEKHWAMLCYLSDQSFEQFIALKDKVEKSAASVPHLARGLSQVSHSLLEKQELFTFPKKNIRDAAQWSLVINTNKNNSEAIKQLLRNKKAKLDEAKISHLLDVLDASGHYESELDPFQTEGIEEYCQKALSTTLRKKLSRLWNNEIEAFWPQNNDVLQYALCVLASNTWGGVPRFTRQVFAMVSEAKRKQLTLKLIENWANGEAHKSDFWVLKLLGLYSDENTVPLLQKLAVQWHKKFRLRAVAVVETLGEIDTAFSLSACDEFYKKSKYSDDVRIAAKKALTQAAERRGINLQDLYDELVPTFGLEDGGLLLDVGPRTYCVTLKPTLDLIITDQNSGKSYKSFPKAKADEDVDLRATADSQFKLLKKNIRPAIKSLNSRFTESFECGQSWSSSRWKTLFLEHPILALVGQGFVWQTGDKTFRISEDLSLIDFDDNPMELDSNSVKLMHPVEVDTALCQKWKAHFDDYEIKSFIDQFTPIDLDRVNWEQDTNEMNLFVSAKAPYGKFKRLMEKHNYQVGGGDGSWIDCYSRTYVGKNWRVIVGLNDCRLHFTFDEEMEYGSISFSFDGDTQNLSEVPKRLIATVIRLIDETMS